MAMTPKLVSSIETLNAGARRPAQVPPSAPQKIGILGAGFMGCGIAAVTALAGLDVVLIDRSQELADRGKLIFTASIAAQIRQGNVTIADAEGPLARIKASAEYGDLRDCDLIIESIFEDREAKAAAFKQAQDVAKKTTIFASNTSTFPITSLAEAFERPDQFVGLHFFSPVEKMRLAEVIKGGKTSDRSLAVAFDYARAIGKTPIIVKDGYEFFINRCVNAYLREGHLMVSEGVPAALVETLAQAAGMPVGPLALSDEVGIDLVYKIICVMKQERGFAAIDLRQESLLECMVAKQGRHGRKNRQGFYDYTEGQTKSLWPSLSDVLAIKGSGVALDEEELKARFLVIQALEAIRSLEQGIIADPREADVGSVLGFGFAASTGGVLSYVDEMGATAFDALCEHLTTAYGGRFTPPALLKDLAKTGETFYGRFGKD